MADDAAATLDLPLFLDEIRDGIGQAVGIVGEIVDAVDGVLSLLPEPVVGPLRRDIERLRELLDAAVAGLNELMPYAGSPAGLRAAGAAWTHDVGARASMMAGFATLDAVRADDLWTGMAADGYRASLPPQNAALIAVKAASDDIDSTLQDIAAALDSFWVAVAGAVATLVAGLMASRFAAAATAVAGPLGAAAAVAGATACLVILVNFLVNALNSLTTLTNQAAIGSAELDRRLANNDAFRGGAWPRSTSDLSDGSLTDGDDTDWHLRVGSR